MKVSDLFLGIKAASGAPIIHLALFVGTLFIPVDQTCCGIDYGLSIKLLIISHILNAFKFW